MFFLLRSDPLPAEPENLGRPRSRFEDEVRASAPYVPHMLVSQIDSYTHFVPYSC